MIKHVNRLGKYFNTIKTIYEKCTANIILNGEKLKAFSLRSGTRQAFPFLSLLFNKVTEHSIWSITKTKRNKGIQIRKEVKLSLFEGDMILYKGNH